MKRRGFHGFLVRCVALGVLLSLLSACLSFVTCYYSLFNEERRQEDQAMYIAAATAAQRMDNLLKRFDLLMTHAQQSDAYQRLAQDDYATPYDRVYDQSLYSKTLEPFLSKLTGVDVLITTFRTLSVTTRQDLASSTHVYRQWENPEAALGAVQELPEGYYLRQQDGDVSITATGAKDATGQTVSFTLLLNDSFWQTLTGGEFSVVLTDSAGALCGPQGPIPAGDASCTVPLNHAGWSLQVLYRYQTTMQAERQVELPLFLALWLPLSGGLVYITMSRRLKALRRLQEAMEVRLNGATAYAPTEPEKDVIRPGHMLVLLLVLIALFSTAATGVLTFRRFSQGNRRHMDQVYTQAANQVTSYLDGMLAEYQQALETIAVDPQVQTLFRQPGSEGSSQALWALQSKLGYVPPVYGNITMYDLDDRILASTVYTPQYLHTLPVDQNETETTFPLVRQLWQYRPGDWCAIHLSILVAGANRELDGYGEKLGTIRMAFEDDDMVRMLNDLAAENSFCAVYDGQGQLLACTAGFDAPATLQDAPGGEYFDIPARPIQTNGWQVRLFVLRSAVLSHQQRLWSLAAIMLAGLMVMLSLLCIAIERNLLSAIRTLSGCMEQVAAQQTTFYRVSKRHPDEIKRLGLQFNRMLRSLDEAKQRSVAMERKSREFEVNMLQSQINPHFLYNTLRTVQVLILQQDPQAISVIDKLITFFRSATNTQVAKIPLREELVQVRSYISIQMVRFASRFQVAFDLPEETLDCQVVRFCLQPLVENAIHHGMADRESAGLIRIEARLSQGELHLWIRDNGKGMSQEDLQKLRHKLDHSEYDSHIGMLNVHQRIQLVFGEGAGLYVESSPDAGTVIHMHFPQGCSQA